MYATFHVPIDDDSERVSFPVRFALFVSAGAMGLGLDIALFEILVSWAG